MTTRLSAGEFLAALAIYSRADIPERLLDQPVERLVEGMLHQWSFDGITCDRDELIAAIDALPEDADR